AAGVDLLARDHGVRRTHDLLAGEVAAHLGAAVEAGDDGADAEGDQDDAGGDAAVSEELAHGVLLVAALTPSTLPAGGGPRIRRGYRTRCGFPAATPRTAPGWRGRRPRLACRA